MEKKIDIYNNSKVILERKTPSNIISWITILIVFLILFFIISFIPFNVYKPYYGTLSIVDGNAFFISKLEYSDFPYNKNKKLYIKNTKYDYDIVGIENNYLTLKIYLNDELKINGNALIINILEDRTNLINIILKNLKKGFDLWKI